MNMYEAFGENLAQQVLEQLPTPVMAEVGSLLWTSQRQN